MWSIDERSKRWPLRRCHVKSDRLHGYTYRNAHPSRCRCCPSWFADMSQSPIMVIGSLPRELRLKRWILEANSFSACRRISAACGIWIEPTSEVMSSPGIVTRTKSIHGDGLPTASQVRRRSTVSATPPVHK